MSIAGILLKQNLIMLVYLLTGFWLYKRRMITKTGSAEFGKMLPYVVMPVAIIRSFIQDYSAELVLELGISFLLAVLALFLAIVISSLFSDRIKR